MFKIHMGVPEMEEFWKALQENVRNKKASQNDERLYNRFGKALVLLANNPGHPGLHSHEITSLSARYGMKVWESYLQNNTPAAGRIFWVYGPGKGDITVIGLEPHPNDKSNAYKKITLSAMGEILD